MRRLPRDYRQPARQAWPGEVWAHDWDGAVALVIGEREPRTGNCRLLMLDCGRSWQTRPGQAFGAAVATAKGWRRIA